MHICYHLIAIDWHNDNSLVILCCMSSLRRHVESGVEGKVSGEGGQCGGGGGGGGG